MRRVLVMFFKVVATLLLIPAVLVSMFLAMHQDTRAADNAWHSTVRSTDARLAQQLASYAMEHAGSYPSSFQQIPGHTLNELRLPSGRSQFVTRAIWAGRIVPAAIAAALIAILLLIHGGSRSAWRFSSVVFFAAAVVLACVAAFLAHTPRPRHCEDVYVLKAGRHMAMPPRTILAYRQPESADEMVAVVFNGTTPHSAGEVQYVKPEEFALLPQDIPSVDLSSGRWSRMQLLHAMNDDVGLTAVLHARTASDDSLREEVSQAIMTKAPRISRCAPVLGQWLAEEKNQYVQQYLGDALGRMTRVPASVFLGVLQLPDTREWPFQREIAKQAALMALAKARPVPADVHTFIVQRLNDYCDRGWWQVIWLLVRLQDRESLLRLQKMTAPSNPWDYWFRIRYGLAVVDGDLGLLEREIATAEAVERASLARALAEFPAAKSLPVLERLAADKDAGVRNVAAWALGRLASADTILVLDRLVDDADYDVSRQAVFSLSEIGGSKTLEILKRRTAHVPARLPAEMFEAIDRAVHDMGNTEAR